jgi:hypothetical protein
MVILFVIHGTGSKIGDVHEVDGMDTLARWRMYHLIIVCNMTPVEAFRCEFDGIASGIVVKLTCRTPNAFSMKIFVTRWYGYDGNVVVERNFAFGLCSPRQ